MAPQSNTTIQEEPHLDRFPRLRVYGDSVIRLSSIGSLLGVVAGPLKVLLDQDRKEITVDDITGTAAVGALVSLAACSACPSRNMCQQRALVTWPPLWASTAPITGDMHWYCAVRAVLSASSG